MQALAAEFSGWRGKFRGLARMEREHTRPLGNVFFDGDVRVDSNALKRQESEHFEQIGRLKMELEWLKKKLRSFTLDRRRELIGPKCRRSILNEYRSVDDAWRGISKYFSFYNDQRPHSSLENQPPAAVYYRTLQNSNERQREETAGFSRSFRRKIYI